MLPDDSKEIAHIDQDKDARRGPYGSGLRSFASAHRATPTPDLGLHAGRARMPELGKAMLDMLVMGLACDLTRVGTMQWVDSQAYNTFPFLQLFDGHHAYQHDHGYQP